MTPTWRDGEPDQFAAAVLAAAEQLGVLPLAVEKDYWACEALRAIALSHPGEVVFKGGTSLEKLRIVRRFSEDLDLLVVGDYHSHRAAERALRMMVESAARATNGAPNAGRSGGRPGSFHRSAYLSPRWRTAVDRVPLPTRLPSWSSWASQVARTRTASGPSPHS